MQGHHNQIHCHILFFSHMQHQDTFLIFNNKKKNPQRWYRYYLMMCDTTKTKNVAVDMSGSDTCSVQHKYQENDVLCPSIIAIVESERREVALKEKLGQQPVVINMDQQGATQEAQKRSSLRSVPSYRGTLSRNRNLH